jgi:hypothetical protein
VKTRDAKSFIKQIEACRDMGSSEVNPCPLGIMLIGAMAENAHGNRDNWSAEKVVEKALAIDTNADLNPDGTVAAKRLAPYIDMKRHDTAAITSMWDLWDQDAEFDGVGGKVLAINFIDSRPGFIGLLRTGLAICEEVRRNKKAVKV